MQMGHLKKRTRQKQTAHQRGWLVSNQLNEEQSWTQLKMKKDHQRAFARLVDHTDESERMRTKLQTRTRLKMMRWLLLLALKLPASLPRPRLGPHTVLGPSPILLLAAGPLALLPLHLPLALAWASPASRTSPLCLPRCCILYSRISCTESLFLHPDASPALCKCTHCHDLCPSSECISSNTAAHNPSSSTSQSSSHPRSPDRYSSHRLHG